MLVFWGAMLHRDIGADPPAGDVRGAARRGRRAAVRGDRRAPRDAADERARSDILSMLVEAVHEDGRRWATRRSATSWRRSCSPGTRRPRRRCPGRWTCCTATRRCSRGCAAAEDGRPGVPRRGLQRGLRIRPVVPMVGRTVTEPTCEIGEHAIPAGTRLAVAMLITHHREDVFPEPAAFRPERFLGRAARFRPTAGCRSAAACGAASARASRSSRWRRSCACSRAHAGSRLAGAPARAGARDGRDASCRRPRRAARARRGLAAPAATAAARRRSRAGRPARTTGSTPSGCRDAHSIAKPAAAIAPTVSRAVWQPPKARGQKVRSAKRCQRAIRGVVARARARRSAARRRASARGAARRARAPGRAPSRARGRRRRRRTSRPRAGARRRRRRAPYGTAACAAARAPARAGTAPARPRRPRSTSPGSGRSCRRCRRRLDDAAAQAGEQLARDAPSPRPARCGSARACRSARTADGGRRRSAHPTDDDVLRSSDLAD